MAIGRFTRSTLAPVSLGLGLLALSLSPQAFAQDAVAPRDRKGSEPPAARIDDRRIRESSGLARSSREPGLFWTHNDSGDGPELFAFDTQGKVTGSCRLRGIDPVDWEDMAPLAQDGVNRLIVADVGDNNAKRKAVTLIFFDEPDPRGQSDVADYQVITLRYPDGPRDCEAVMVDSVSGVVTLVSKTFLPGATIHTCELPPRKAGRVIDDTPRELRRVGGLPLSLVTGIDHDPQSGDVLVINYFQLFRFPKPRDDRPWWLQTPRPADLPRFKQIEAVAADAAGSAWVTSEGTPAPFGKVNESAFPPQGNDPPATNR
jgi:hypothetical protein